MSVLQRRLASSTWALLKSLERREQKLADELALLEMGLLSNDQLDARQLAMPTMDVRNDKTGDEEEGGTGEEGERQDNELAAATDAHTAAELRAELAEVRQRVALARSVYAAKRESKFERLWEALSTRGDTKILIFTEHKDTMDFLVTRLEGLGFTGKVARIHGGLDFREREEQVEAFRKPADQGGAQYLVATDAAGEGINLQFCWLLVNYDIPWNPARIEQRMGRVHRYKQRHDVLLLNLVAGHTREGRVLKVLLDKIERIRKELGSDKVFDVIGQQLGNIALTDLLLRATVEGRVEEAERAIDNALTAESVQAYIEEQARKVELTEVRSMLDVLRQQREDAAIRRMMPAYARRFFERAAPFIGVGIAGDIRGLFGLTPCPDPVRRAVNTFLLHCTSV